MSRPFHPPFPLNRHPLNTKSSAPCPTAFRYTPPPLPAVGEHPQFVISLLFISYRPLAPSTYAITPPASDISDRHTSNTLLLIFIASTLADVSVNTLDPLFDDVTRRNELPFITTLGISFPLAPSLSPAPSA
ncbi:uncharacterized protein MONOS_16162 [Monocercomonoides exilis]|uniref:uncharacterized protein n=1 Tax=Monocercomonoides exilis TaxID=2049356 RepID=UPI00355A26C2|nr:hypothetical protein MONOS_16162 [Monocercomonoides exilis]|eukprot:MONOS_16162.1-p1 / transcript=MONOS_16162.1 / gene=MONOS_16162 / organism=Monocercomonoides_exilis_PA203 / gene_product=unspecified product / transcript_product=unspecified product / location=Mono_scaffold01533:6246-6641(-) / protein_length=132 / sequence_SO=supercontig / SO=protein_coding / is_pseudo=false